MDSLKVIGGANLKGKIKISGAKNSALPLMACSLLLSKGELKLDSMPNLADTRFMSILNIIPFFPCKLRIEFIKKPCI